MSSDQQDLLANALSSIANAVFITDRDGRIVWANEAFSRLSGYATHEALGRSPAMLKSGRQDAEFYRELWQTILAGSVWRGEVVERRKDGSLYAVDETITPLCDAAGNITYFVATLHDTTLRKKEGDRDHFLAYHDSLTGLPNRALFLRLLEQALAHCARSARRLAVLFIDLDHFKPVNDTLGHQLGDLLLATVAERLRASVRKSDVVARLAGDEFTVIQTDIVDVRPARALARTLVRALGPSASRSTRKTARVPRNCCNAPISRCTGRRNRGAIVTAFTRHSKAAAQGRVSGTRTSPPKPPAATGCSLMYRPILALSLHPDLMQINRRFDGALPPFR